MSEESGPGPALRATPDLPRVVILGAGPAGCGAAYQLRRTGKASVSVIERGLQVGGNAGSFKWCGQWLDYGSHRLHHAIDPSILSDLQGMLGEALRDRERHGRIRLRDEWLHFPIKTADLLRRLDKRFAFGMVRDMTARTLKNRDEGDTFASVLLANLGPTMCHSFYFPYARKLWGAEPEELSGIQARKRVTAGSFTKLLARLIKPPGGGRFYYPHRGYGQISEAYAASAREMGAEIALGWTVTGVEPLPSASGWRVSAERNGERREFDADYVWSTIPVTLLARMMAPPAPAAVLAAAKEIDYRAMVLVYLQLPRGRFTDTDAHYFPEGNVRITRLSEPKNYFGSVEPRGTTVLCGEYPCSPGDDLWDASDEQLRDVMLGDMATAGLPSPGRPTKVLVKRLRQAYPIYRNGYEKPLGILDSWAESIPGLLVYGRQGLFAHDNAHHALYMAYAAVDCLETGRFNTEKWERYRAIFRTHVIED